MSLTAAQICTRAAAIAKFNGATSVAGLYLNAVLQELCQTYDFELARKNYVFDFNPSSTTTVAFPNNVAGSGPYTLPADYLRCQKGEFLWYLNGVPYPMIAVDMAEFDRLVQQANMQSYPAIFATDMSTAPPNGAAATAVIWPPASGSYEALIRYFAAMPDITTPETSSTIPWFPSQTYLITRVAGELMKETSDSRWRTFLGTGDEGAQGILDRYLKNKDDNSDRAKRVTLDARRFGPNFRNLANTKIVGW